jgi:Flp pilus assembly protein TadG
MGRIDSRIGFLTRLARDVRGNTIAIMAAAMLPLAGLIGGGVDMSRLYLTKTRLQQACDAGALAGRKAMAAGSWTTGTGSTNDKADKMFGANFSSGQYGTSGLTKSFILLNNDPVAGVVQGTASATVPMTIMKVFGMTPRTLTVTCNSKMQLPNTDVMFVLDMTLSMQDLPSCNIAYCNNGVNGQRRIDGLKKAVKCFYEALEKVGTPEPCHFVSGTTYDSIGDPTATTTSTTAQVRLGFVPYGVNVNVGRILPNSVMANEWVYQSRAANSTPTYAYTLGTETPAPTAITNWSNWSSAPGGLTTLNSGTAYTGSWTLIATTAAPPPLNGYARYTSDTNTTNCQTNRNLNNGAVGYIDTPSVQSPALQSTTNSPPTYVSGTNPSQQLLTYNQSDNHTAVAYKYVYVSTASNGQKCQLQQSIKTYSLTRSNGTTTKSITWDTAHPYAVATGTYTYQPIKQLVSGLKLGGSNWAGSVSIPNLAIGTTTLPSPVYLSGSNSATSSISTPVPATVTWGGCIEEAQTFQNTDGNASDDWGTLPATAYDMNVNLIPDGTSTSSDWGSSVASRVPWLNLTLTPPFGPGTFWGPMLKDAVWARYTGTNASSNWTQNAVTTATSLSQSNFDYYCTSSPARKLQEYPTNTSFLAYVNALDAQDIGTYHDIGMLWGARLISPLGIFASENASAGSGGPIQRHLIFMTDGGTNTVYNSYNAYGLSFYNRYQFSADVSSSAGEAKTDAALNARLIQLCNQIKNMNITLWVVSYGASVDSSGSTTNEDRLRSCATDSNHFFSATDTPTLIANFQSIASKISELRLTN